MRPPKLIKPYVIAIARQVVGRSDVDLFYVACRPVRDAEENDCFSIVPTYVNEHGGAAVLGWAIWERPKAFIEAEFHMIWRHDSGEYLDITPRHVPIPRTLFVVDPHRRYQGCQLDNVRKSLTKDKNVKRFLEMAARNHKLMNEGALKHYHGPVVATPEMLVLQQELAALELRIISRYGHWLPENLEHV